MKTTLFSLLVVSLFSLAFVPMDAGDQDKERAAIEKAARDYMEGWYEGSVERMTKALHPDLMKRRIDTLPTGKNILNTVSAQAMIEYTRAGFGKGKPVAERGISVDVLDVYENIATAKAMSEQFVDYLHMAKNNGEWKIVNVLWAPNKP